MLGKLVPCGGGAPLPLLKPKLLAGRNPDCDVSIPCSTVSSRHCTFEFHEGTWWVNDLNSKNGTSVNGHRCEKQKVAPNDILTLGRQRFVINYQRAVPTIVPTSKREIEEDLALEFLNSALDESGSVNGEPAKSAAVPMMAPTVPQRPANSISRSSDLGRLIPCGGGPPLPLRRIELVLGRSQECDICLRFASISSRHCQMNFADGYWLVEDLNSKNGTWVDGERCMLQCLMPESVLSLDKHRFTIHYVSSGDGPPPVVKQLFSQSLLEKAGLLNEFTGDRLGGQLLSDDSADRPKRYNLLEPDE